MRIFTLFIMSISLFQFLPIQLHAQTTQSYQHGSGSLILPKAKPRASVILMGGGHGRLSVTNDGAINRLLGNQVIRTRHDYVSQGFAVLALDSGGNLQQAVDDMRKIAQPVVIVGTSAAATRVHKGLNADAIVLTSAMLSWFQSNVASPASLPPIFLIHHKEDACFVTKPSLVDPFIAWSEGRAKVTWVTGGQNEGDACEEKSYHGFAGLDGKIVALVSNYVRQVKVRR